MEVTFIEVLTVYGPLGILAAVMFLFAVKLFRVLQEERAARDEENTRLSAAYRDEIQGIATEHKAEMQAMVERYIKTTTSQVEQYHNLADKISAVLESLTHRVRR